MGLPAWGGSNRPNLHTLMKNNQGGSQWETPSTLHPLRPPPASTTWALQYHLKRWGVSRKYDRTGVPASMGGGALPPKGTTMES